ncbi:hypothetical protein H310_11262 [Aphanomyces invadans]|uniref:Ubiquitin carboxyl-terminal hydrolase n=1 Tax=Aphanomyces invadans TaxID=157072 RepID=A0A024TMM1_9STRA|nr:hypothetical protein H310_11262 [Aphanomyces invadans]ETV95380.1 hypothetical protein H310_11262 [Aphanomyces invadans]|eukprot:XP_008876081.1 hypothetical protein H310_11262 [Aphanomyces invadans]
MTDVSVPGLRNLGNSCYFNAVLQALAASGCFQEYLTGLVEAGDVASEQRPFTSVLQQCLADLSPQRRAYISSVVPRDLNSMLSEDTSMFRGMHQQDAEEGFQFIMEKLEKEVNRSKPDAFSLSTLLPTRAPNSADTDTSSIHPFHGLTGNVLECSKCHMQKPISTDYFLDLKLSLCPSMDSQRPFRTLRESLRHYTRKEQIDEVECTHCTFLQLLLAVDNALHALAAAPYADSRSFPTTTRSSEDPSDDDDRDARLFNFRRLRDMLSHRVETNSGNPVCDVDLDDPHCWTPDQLSIWNANTTFFQQLGIWDTDKRIPDLPRAHATFFRHVILARPPKVLTFHINRNVYVHDTIVKLDVHLAFDESLRLAHPFVRHCEAISYALVAVVVHHGNERGGHYTCYRRVTSARHWVHISDEHVVDVAFADVLRAKAYMLFYEITSP